MVLGSFSVMFASNMADVCTTTHCLLHGSIGCHTVTVISTVLDEFILCRMCAQCI